jgi:hypothetical protein
MQSTAMLITQPKSSLSDSVNACPGIALPSHQQMKRLAKHNPHTFIVVDDVNNS